MYPKVISNSDCLVLRKKIEDAQAIAITCHVSPDGDAIGSSLALYHILIALGKRATIITPDQLPNSLRFLPGTDCIIPYSCNQKLANKALEECDLIFCLDYNSLYRIDTLGEDVKKSPAYKILIDHHLEPEKFTNIEISRPEISSTCLLLLYVINQLGYFDKINAIVAECIYVGMMTDTGNFSYNSSDPYIYIAISDLLKKGINKDDIYNHIYNSNSESRLRICGYALERKMKLYREHHAALITLDKNELIKYNYCKGDTEGLVNVPLSIPGIQYSAFLREDSEYIKISMRSVGNFPVNELCEKYFNGGGHKNAAGGEFYDSLSNAINLFESLLNENKKYFEEYANE